MAPIVDYSAPVKVSAYADLIKTELSDLLKAGDNKATEFKVPTVDANKVRVEFAKAANDAGKTARIRVQENDGKVDKDGNPTGNTRFGITLTGRHAARAKAGKATEAEAAK